MTNSGIPHQRLRPRLAQNAAGEQWSVEHYLRVLFYRKWLILGFFLLVSCATAVYSYRIQDVYTSETVILVDPQKVPETYVKATVTGDIRNRLGALSQQLLSATRLQAIIDAFNLYPELRNTAPREDIITRMRNSISVAVVTKFGASQDLQAFRIAYSNPDPQVAAQVTNKLASLYIEENLKAREQQATDTTQFLQNQLQAARKTLEEQEARLKDFKLRHAGQMPEQQTAVLQILGQLQSQLQVESDALGRAEQQRSYIRSMMSQSAPVVDIDDAAQRRQQEARRSQEASGVQAQLAAAMSRYTENHPEVQRLKGLLEEEKRKAGQAAAPAAAPSESPEPAVAPPAPTAPVNTQNPVLVSQLQSVEAEIQKHKEEQQRLQKQIAEYRAKLEAIPIREQQIVQLVRDYEISKTHYTQLLGKQMSAETATQLEIRQKGEKFSILDPAQVPERPSSPNRPLINAAGCLAGLLLGLALAIAPEFFGMSITAGEQLATASGYPVLEVIPVIRTRADRVRTRRLAVAAAASGTAMLLACIAVFYFR